MRKAVYIHIIFLMSFYGAMAQIQPFSRQDSALLNHSLEKYDLAIGKKAYKEAAYSLNQVAYLYWDHNSYDDAIKNYEQSLELNKSVGNENGIAMISNNLGMLYSDVKNYQASLGYFEATLATRRANKETIAIIAALINITVVKNTLQKYDEAILHLEEAMSLAREKNDLEQMQSCYGMLAETYQKKGDAKKSLYYFEFYKSFSELRGRNKIKNVEVALEKVKLQKASVEHERRKADQQLTVKQGEIHKLKTKIGEADTILSGLSKKLDEKNTQLTLARQEKEIYNLKAEKKQQLLEKESKKRQSDMLLAGLIIGFLLLLFLIALISSKKIKDKNTQLSDQNKKILHINEELESANHVKNTLFSSIAHDLKSPLAQLEQTFTFLDDDMLEESEKKMMLDAVRKGLKQSNLLLENLLLWANSQMHDTNLKETEVDIQSAIDESVFVLESLYKEKNIHLDKKYDHTGSVYCDEGKLKLIVRNLTSNAIKFTPQKGIITLSTGKRGNQIYIAVADSGVGMTEEQIEKLFDTSTNTTTYGTDREKGTGIGLKLCDQFIREMQGKILVKSDVDQGTTFTVLIPTKNSNLTNTTNEEDLRSNESVMHVY